MFKVSRKPPHRGGFVLPDVQRPDAPGRRPLSTRRAQSRPRLACPLYVWKIMQVNGGGRGTVPRASTGRAGDSGSFLRSFTFCQILSLSYQVIKLGCSTQTTSYDGFYCIGDKQGEALSTHQTNK